MQFVLVHGGSFDERTWQTLTPLLEHDAVLVNQPGRPLNPVDDITSIGLPAYRQNVADAVRSTTGDVVLVGHSMAGISLGAGIAAAPDRVRHAVFLSCAVPPEGNNMYTLVDGDVAETASQGLEGDYIPVSREMLRDLMAHDLTPEQEALAASIMVPEPARPFRDPATLAGYELDVPKTWIRCTEDQIFPSALQDLMAERVGATAVEDLAAGHLAMLSQPEQLAGILNRIARSVS